MMASGDSRSCSFMEGMQQFVPDLKDGKVQSALKKLTFFSISIIVAPLGCMFLSKTYLFEGLLGYSTSDSLLYAAILAVVVVHVILGFFVYVAWTEDTTPTRVRLEPAEYKQD